MTSLAPRLPERVGSQLARLGTPAVMAPGARQLLARRLRRAAPRDGARPQRADRRSLHPPHRARAGGHRTGV